MTRPPAPALYLGTVTTGSGVDIRSPEGQQRLAAALLTVKPTPGMTARPTPPEPVITVRHAPAERARLNQLVHTVLARMTTPTDPSNTPKPVG